MNTLGMILSAAAMAALGYAMVATARYYNTNITLPTKRRRIVLLNLDPVREKAMSRHGWTQEKARALEDEYRDFLILLAENDRTISPWSDDLDLFWHEHILDTKRYAQDCNTIFGHIIQHDPHIEKNPDLQAATKAATVALRSAQLRDRDERKRQADRTSSSTDDGFDIAQWGCSADPNPHHGSHSSGSGSHSSSDDGGSHGSHGSSHGDGDAGGGHSGGGHGCSSGHSCGGHSCGGHGCGGGH